jgi:hypothetical protein
VLQHQGGIFSDFGVKVIHKHSHRGFLEPTFATQLVATRGANFSSHGGQSILA